ncbi:MAG: two-component system, chemotaxis family, CheB/CheR fusion protein [Gammaproteobacteria bacterium]|nr:two-component system, chemotaxis family, CheB/CheR fusion protein [Gammaproteobacteria bacterium]
MRATEMHFHRLADSVGQLVWVVDASGRISYGNSSWYAHTGIGAGAKFVRNYLPLLHPEDRSSWERAWGHALASGEAYALECRLRFTAESKYVQHLEWGHPVRDIDGKDPEWIIFATDADEDRRLIAELRRSIARKDQFLALVAHELRGPLSPILTTLQLLAGHVDEPRLVEQSCARIARQFAQLRRLVEDLFDLARSQNAQMILTRGKVELEAAVEAAIEDAQPLIASRRHHLSVVMPSQTTVVNGDAGRLTQVFGNLLVNAAKFTDEAGRICVLIEREPGWALVKVRDSGIGISPDMLQRVFDAYVQAERDSTGSASGLGLGLALARHLIELHGGTVNAYSEGLGRGSEFVVRLPAANGRELLESRAQECNSLAIP